MPIAPNLIQTLTLNGLTVAPSQVRGTVRLVPLLRRDAPGDLRLAKRAYKEDVAVVSLDGPLLAPGIKYISYVPHGMVLSWNSDGSAVAAFGAGFAGADGKRFAGSFASLRVLPRMAKREAGNQLRFLPMHLAMEGFLSLFFSGPEIAWAEYSRRAIRRGLDPRSETAYGGEQVAGFEDALRTFEMHEDQVGVLVFVADALASAFVTPHPSDYRALHRTLLQDFYGELIYQYGLLYDDVLPLEVIINAGKISGLADLRAALGRVRSDWAGFQGFMAHDLLGRPVQSKRVYQAGPFTLQRFITDLNPAGENHMGEAIVRDDGRLEYLKTYRLSAAQTRRAYLLQLLAEAEWHLDTAAERLHVTRDDFVLRLEKAGFGYLLAGEVRDAARKSRPAPLRPLL